MAGMRPSTILTSIGATALLSAAVVTGPATAGPIVAEWEPGLTPAEVGGAIVVDGYGVNGLGAYQVVLGDGATHLAVCVEADVGHSLSADYVVETLASAPPGTLVVIDYLQLLDQKRENPNLAAQIQTLKRFARDRGLIIVFISQIDRSYDPSKKPFPDIGDVRLPNQLDLTLFDKTCFLNNGEFRFQ